jgi:hypothetical protein
VRSAISQSSTTIGDLASEARSHSRFNRPIVSMLIDFRHNASHLTTFFDEALAGRLRA